MTPDLKNAVRQDMLRRGFRTDIPAEALAEAAAHTEPDFAKTGLPDLTDWLWSSIDNDDTRDLDQIEYAESDPRGIRLYVAIANVIHFVPHRSSLDRSAYQNTTSVYTGVETFHMLPDRLATDLSSLSENKTRLAMVNEMLIGHQGQILFTKIYPAIVSNHAQLTYTGTAAWLDGKTPALSGRSAATLHTIDENPHLQEQLRLQQRAAQALRDRRQKAGALSFQMGEVRSQVNEKGEIELIVKTGDAATRVIEDLMIATNQTGHRTLADHGYPILQRVVRIPKRWPRIVAIAAQRGFTLPTEPNSEALGEFLSKEQQEDADHYDDLSLAILKLLGRGEYVVTLPGDPPIGHFGLATPYYAHSTAPNRRYPDLMIQRLLEAAAQDQPSPYSVDALRAIAQRCTHMEDEASKVERFARKAMAAQAMLPRIGQTFEGIITGAADKGTWVKLRQPPIEGRVVKRTRPVDVGDRVTVRLVLADPQRGYIDFELI